MKSLRLWWMAFLPLLALPWFWFRPGELIFAVDFPFPLSGKLALARTLSPWDAIDNLGWIFGAQYYPPRLLVNLLHAAFELIRVNFEPILLGLHLLLPALSVGLLSYELLNKLEEPKRRLAALVAGYFAALNLYLMVQIVDQAMVLQLTFVPLILYFSFRASETRKYTRYGLLTALVSPGLAVINPSSSAAGLLLIVIAWLRGLLLKYRAKDPVNLKGFARYIALAVVGSLLINAWWLLPFVSTLSSFTGSIEIPTTAWLLGTSSGTSLLNVIRLIGAWDWFAQFNEQPYAPYAASYLGLKPLSLLAFVPAILALVGWLKRPNRTFNLFALIALLGIVLAAGAHPPTGPIYRLLFEYLPGFWLFRSPWYKFSLWIVIGFAPLIGWAVVWLSQKLRIRDLGVSVIVVVLFGLLVHPLITGSRFERPTPQRTLAASRVEIPGYVYETARFLNSTPGDGRILLLPQLFHDTTKYHWGYGSLRSPLYDLLERRAIVYRFFGQRFDYTPLLDKLIEALKNSDKATIQKITDLLGVEYLLHQKDFDLAFFKDDPSLEQLEQYLKLFDGKLAFEAGDWQVYQLSETELAQGLSGLVATDRFDNLFEQAFPKQTALVEAVPSELGDQNGGMVRLTLDDIRKQDGVLDTSFSAPLPGSYQIKGKVASELKINGQPLRSGENIALRAENQLALEPSNQLPLANADFRAGLKDWLIQNLALNPDGSIQRGVVAAPTNQGPAAELKAVGDWVALYRDLPALKVHAIVISFDVDQKNGQFEVAIDQPATHKSFSLLTDSTPKKRHYDLIVYGDILDQPTQLYFYLRVDQSGEAIARVSNVKLHQVEQPVELFLVRQPAGFKFTSFSFERRSPTTIKLQTEANGPFVIHLKEHYDPAWTLKAEGFSAKPIKVNKTTMAFVVDRADLKQFTVEFGLSRPYRMALALSLLNLIGLITALRYYRS